MFNLVGLQIQARWKKSSKNKFPVITCRDLEPLVQLLNKKKEM
uniref:Uncharacterized protein n=1 Tax=Arundo donax TaxID=35708 RepID=A0A0A9BS74_ARUDO